MGNAVEDRFESDEVERAAYALDRMSPSEIARIISGDMRVEVAAALLRLNSSSNETAYNEIIDLNDIHYIHSLPDEPYEHPESITIAFYKNGSMGFTRQTVFDLKDIFGQAVINIGEEFHPVHKRERRGGTIVPLSHIQGIGSRYKGGLGEFYLITKDSKNIKLDPEHLKPHSKESDIRSLLSSYGISDVLSELGMRCSRDPQHEIYF